MPRNAQERKTAAQGRGMESQERIGALLARMRETSPAGFAIALHVRFTAPRYLFQSYEKTWLDTYSREGLVLHDPVVRWGFTNEGTVRWSDLDDPAGVMTRARAFGMTYGAVIALIHDGSRSMGGFARSDREMTDAEVASLRSDLGELHDITAGVEAFSPAVHTTLKQMSVYLTHG